WKSILTCSSIFFFQAEDGIRDRNVTGVQTCALPIYFQVSVALCDCAEQIAADAAKSINTNAGSHGSCLLKSWESGVRQKQLPRRIRLRRKFYDVFLRHCR